MEERAKERRAKERKSKERKSKRAKSQRVKSEFQTLIVGYPPSAIFLNAQCSVVFPNKRSQAKIYTVYFRISSI